jgi:hypothetical protein
LEPVTLPEVPLLQAEIVDEPGIRTMLRKPGGGLMVRTEALADTHDWFNLAGRM